MAKAPKTTAPTVNRALLTAIVNATVASTYIFVTQAEALSAGLSNAPPLIEVNADIADPNDANKRAAMATDAGKAFLAAPEATAVPITAPSPYAIIKNAVLPEAKRRFGGGGAPTVYPFETMEIGDSFFVPVSEKHPDPLKTLGSTVSSVNHKFSEATGETKSSKRAKRGEDKKPVLGADGKKIVEDVIVNVRKPVRKFTIRAVEAGKAYGEFQAPGDGVLIARVNLPAKIFSIDKTAAPRATFGAAFFYKWKLKWPNIEPGQKISR